MSNRCPHCGAEAGKSHEPCPYAPGGKKYEGPAPRKTPSKPAEIAATATIALAEPRRPALGDDEEKTPAPEIAPQGPASPEAGADDSEIAASHPDCKRCAQVRRQTRERVRKTREKKVSE
jgi:hypothetical protein